MPHITVKVDGLDDLQRKLRNPLVIKGPLKELLTDASKVGTREAWDTIDGGTGIAVRSIGARVRPLEAYVYSAMAKGRALSIEEGRPPGADVKAILPQIIRWKKAVGHPDSGIEIAHRIRLLGAKGKHFLKAAGEKVTENMPPLVQKMAKQIEEMLK